MHFNIMQCCDSASAAIYKDVHALLRMIALVTQCSQTTPFNTSSVIGCKMLYTVIFLNHISGERELTFKPSKVETQKG